MNESRGWDEMLRVARGLVLEAGELLREAAADRAHLEVRRKGRVDLVTAVDERLQAFLVAGLKRRFPGHRVVAEEGAAGEDIVGDRRPVWYVDPLDGTTNFVHGHPFSAVSLGLYEGDRPRVGLVGAPLLDELFLASEGGGAWLEHPRAGGAPLPLECSAAATLEEALLGTGFPYARGALARLNLSCCAHALARSRGLRRAGSAAIDLCWVAAGRLDGYWEMTLAPWDVGAGALVAREAGALVTDFAGGEDWLHGGRVCAAGPALHPQLLEMLAAAHREPEHWPLGEPLPAVPLRPEVPR